MAGSFEILQQVRNKVDTAQVGWERFAKATIPRYNAAFNEHKAALKAAELSLKREQENGWLVLSTVLSLTAGFWTPRFLKPVGQGFADDLVEEWVALPLSKGMKEFAVHVGSGVGSEVLSHVGSQLNVNAQALLTHQTGNKYDPVVEDTLDWGSRLEEGIKNRSYTLKSGMDRIMDNAGKWSAPAADFFQKAFIRFCPFITDMPGDPNEGDFRQNFQRMSGLTMWRAWGRVRDEKWWKDNPSHNSLRHMGSIFNALVGLGVPPHEIGNYHGWQGTSLGSARRPGWMFDMNKFIAWAKKFEPGQIALWGKKTEESEQVCRAVDDRLVLKKQVNACYVGGAR